MANEAMHDEEPTLDVGTGEEALEEPLARAERERDEYLAQYQRALADYQNLRRRTHEDIQSAVRRERAALLEEMLTVLDYLDMALAAPCASEDAKALLFGVQLTRDQLWALLERQGVSPIPPAESFDPEIHQALATVESELPPGTIVETVRRGFRVGTGVLRYAQVKVATQRGDDAERARGAD